MQAAGSCVHGTGMTGAARQNLLGIEHRGRYFILI
jgi:hypothetical protein